MLARSRALVIGLAVLAFVLTVAGLAIHGPVGGALLLVMAVGLVALTQTSWGHVRAQGRIGRMIVVAGFSALGIAKLAGKA